MSERARRNSRYIDPDEDKADALQKGFEWLARLASQDEDKHHALVAVDAKTNLENVRETVEDILGAGGYRDLHDDNQLTINDVRLSLVTKRISPSGWQGGPVLVIYPSPDLLDTVDGLDGVTDVLVLTWMWSDVEEWVRTWNASPLDQEDRQDDGELLENPLVEEAMETMCRTVNESTGMTDRRDRSSAIELFKILDEAGVAVVPEDVRAWLVAERGWDPEHADAVAELAQGVREGRQFQYDRGQWADDILETLRERAEE